jgi:hypothetical protein
MKYFIGLVVIIALLVVACSAQEPVEKNNTTTEINNAVETTESTFSCQELKERFDTLERPTLQDCDGWQTNNRTMYVGGTLISSEATFVESYNHYEQHHTFKGLNTEKEFYMVTNTDLIELEKGSFYKIDLMRLCARMMSMATSGSIEIYPEDKLEECME